MPLPKRLARFNRSVTNRVTGAIACWAPGFAIIEHAGRRSGRTYRTPVNAFRRGETMTIALTYGAGGDWVKNVLAAGGCVATVRRRRVTLREPVVVRDERRRAAPAPVRLVLRALGVAEFLELTVVEREE